MARLHLMVAMAIQVDDEAEGVAGATPILVVGVILIRSRLLVGNSAGSGQKRIETDRPGSVLSLGESNGR